MRTLPILVATLALVIAPATFAANPAAPGQDRTCLVTTGVPNSWNDVDVTGTKWLPRKAAEVQAKKDPRRMRVFDYANDPLVTRGTYSSAEQLCKEHFD